jgi:hypothetical protein
MNEAAPALPDLDALRAAGAARVDAVGWHYIETLASRTQAQSGPARLLLHAKLQEAIQRFETRMGKNQPDTVQAYSRVVPSPMGTLLQDIRQKNASQVSGQTTGSQEAENPRIQAFKKQLNKISVQKQVTQAIAQAPQNAGPINSHMLVLRSLGLMRDISPDYLNRFMAHVDTLLCLEEAGKGKLTPKRASPSAKNRS